MAFAQNRSFAGARPIPGAVATAGVSDRVAFLRRTYAHLGVTLIAWAALTAGILRYAPETSLRFSKWAFGGGLNWFLVLGAFMAIGWVAQKLATSDSSRGLQYVGLAVGAVAEAAILQPMLWIAMLKFSGTNAVVLTATGIHANPSPEFFAIIGQAAAITLAIFVGLTLTVFVTKKDFSFMRGALMIGSFAALGIIGASMLFGFSLGMLFTGAMILLMAGYILYQTSLVMAHFPPTQYVAAALMLFSTVATLFWYVLQLLMSRRN